MFKIIFLMLLMVGSIAFAADEAKSHRYQVKIDGMVCNFCVESIKIRLKKNSEVKDVEIVLAKKLVTITTNPGQDLSEDKIKESIRDTGYTPEDLKKLE